MKKLLFLLMGLSLVYNVNVFSQTQISIEPDTAKVWPGDTIEFIVDTSELTVNTYEWFYKLDSMNDYDTCKNDTNHFQNYSTDTLKVNNIPAEFHYANFYCKLDTKTGTTLNSDTAIMYVASDNLFNYEHPIYLKNCNDPDPDISVVGGVFKGECIGIDPPGILSIDSLTGIITLESSDIGTFIISYEIRTDITYEFQFDTIKIIKSLIYSVEYEESYCQNEDNPKPEINIAPADSIEFRCNDSGLVFVDSFTGEINLEESLPNSYLINYTIYAPCEIIDSLALEIIPITEVDVSYQKDQYCQMDANPIPIISDTAYSDSLTFYCNDPNLIINDLTGEINLSESEPGKYFIDYHINAQCVPGGSLQIEIVAMVDVQVSYDTLEFCQNEDNPKPEISPPKVKNHITFRCDDENLVFKSAQTGEIDLMGSEPGNYLIEYDIDQEICPDKSYGEFNISIFETPPIPNIIIKPDDETPRVLICSDTGYQYQWYGPYSEGSSPNKIEGATLQFYYPQNFNNEFISGKYGVKIYKEEEKCSNYAEVNLSISEKGNEIKVFPNPNNGFFTLVMPGSNTDKSNYGEIIICNTAGKIVYKKNIERTLSAKEHEVNIQKLKRGIYLLEVSCSDIEQFRTKIFIW